jgi:hypothetical protein
MKTNKTELLEQDFKHLNLQESSEFNRFGFKNKPTIVNSALNLKRESRLNQIKLA